MTQSEPVRVQPVGAARFGRRNVAMASSRSRSMLLLAEGSGFRFSPGRTSRGRCPARRASGPVDMKYAGMRFSREHMLVARYEITGIQDVAIARWHAKPWGYVVLQP
jgi:hypothetical protein